MSRATLDRNGRRTGILSDGTRVNVYRYDDSGDEWTAALHYPDGGYSALTMHGGASEFDEHNVEGPHMGRLITWEAVPPNIRSRIERCAVESSMVANGRRHESNPMLKESDKRVVRAFVNEKPASSNLLETDGVRLDKIGLGGETVAKWINGRIAIVSTESVKSDESIIHLISKVAGPGVVDFSYARKGHRVHEHGAMGRNGRNSAQDAEAAFYYNERKIADAEEELRRPGISAAYRQQMRDLIESSRSEMDYARRSMEPNGRATTVDADAARELDLYIANTYELIGAPNSIGKSIDANLKRKLASGKYDPALAPKAWQYLVDEGAKRYEKEFGSDSPIFNAATRRQVAVDFARAWADENG